MQVTRELATELSWLSGQYPVVALLGPRQAGKTTLARRVFDRYKYANLELPDIRNVAATDPRAFLQRFEPPVIIDEIQREPQLLSYIQDWVDNHKINAQFILTGSNQLQLNEAITQSLAGRVAIIKLLPFSIDELAKAGISLSRNEYLSKGFMPRIYDQQQEPFKAYGNYLETYVERDLRQLINIRNLSHFNTFLKLLAGRVGQVVNLHSLANDVGLSSATLSQWLSVLETSFIIYRLYPYYENFGKRLIKSPKIYFTEPGLVSYLLGIETPSEIGRDPLIGGLFENMVVIDILKTRFNASAPANLYYYRDSNGHEVDLIFENKRMLTPIEIKSAMTFNDGMTTAIRRFQKITSKAGKGYVVYAGELEYTSDNYELRNFKNMRNIFSAPES